MIEGLSEAVVQVKDGCFRCLISSTMKQLSIEQSCVLLYKLRLILAQNNNPNKQPILRYFSNHPNLIN